MCIAQMAASMYCLNALSDSEHMDKRRVLALRVVAVLVVLVVMMGFVGAAGAMG